MYNFKISIILIHLLGNGKAGWKFWKKDKETITTSTTSTSISVKVITTPTIATTIRGLTESAINTGTILIGAADSGLIIDVDGTRHNVRYDTRLNRLNPGTEVSLDIAISRLHKSEISGGNNQNYRDWAMEFTGIGRSIRNQSSRTSVQELATNDDDQTQPNLLTGRSFYTNSIYISLQAMIFMYL